MPRISSTLLYGGLVALYAIYWQCHVLGLSPTSEPLTSSLPKRPFLLHEFLLPSTLLSIALFIPADQKLIAAISLPPIAASIWRAFSAGSPHPIAGYFIGTYLGFITFRVLELLVFRDVRGSFCRYETCGQERKRARSKKDDSGERYPAAVGRRVGWLVEIMCNVRGCGWSWCIPLPTSLPITSRSKWLLKRVFRLVVVCLWLDVLVFYMRVVDRPYWIPDGLEMGAVYPSLFSRGTKPVLDYPPPLGFPSMPEEDGFVKTLYQLALHVFRTIVATSAMYTALAGGHAFGTVIFVSIGVATCPYPLPPGWKARWFAPEAWPDAFGTVLGGDWGLGIRGWWARGWHGLFRSIFTAPADWAVEFFGLDPRGGKAALLVLTIPFGISGLMHAAGAWTRIGGGWGVTQFFCIQPLGILVETLVAEAWKRAFGDPGKGKVVRLWMYIWAVLWFTVTGVSFWQEYRWGGMWTIRPVPFSLWEGRMDLWKGTWTRMAVGAEGGWLGNWAVVLAPA